MTDHLEVRVQDRTMIITLEDPPLNIMTAACWDALDRHVDRAIRDDVRAIVITGTGDRAFCAGSNIHEMLDLDEVTGTAWSRRNYASREKLRSFPWPVICAIEGLALGGGMALALSCDLRVASETAEFGLPEAKVGLVGTANYLLRYLPPGKVKDLVFTGVRMGAEEAHRWGVVERLVPAGTAFEEAMRVAEATFEMSPRAVRLYKSTIDRGMSTSLETALAIELERLQECWGSSERREWVERFHAERARRKADAAARDAGATEE